MWILIISLKLIGASVNTTSIEFNTQTMCEQAKAAYESKASDLGSVKSIVICVKK